MTAATTPEDGASQIVDSSLRACLDALVDSVGVDRAIRDETGRIVDFLIVDDNRDTKTTTGLPVEQQVGQRLCNAFPTVRALRYFDRYCEVVETGAPPIQGAIERPYGWRGLRASRLGDGFLAIWRDITDRFRFLVMACSP